MTDGVPAAGAVADRLRIFPDDARQALRMRRFFIAAATSLLMPLLLLAGSLLGLLAPLTAAYLTSVVFALVLAFYVVFRSGLNLHFRDPSLTAEQIAVSLACTAFIAYWAAEMRFAVAVFYYVTLLFGTLRLNTGRLLVLALIAVLAHGSALWIWHRLHPGAEMAGDRLQLLVLAGTLPWFAAMGGYVNSLRARLSDSHRRLKSAYDRIEQIAVRDELTGAYNRRFLLEALAREQARAKRLGTSYSVCLLDIDHFKSINDTFGHAAGDAVLKHFALIAGAGLRDVDIFGRYGGEEFLLILPDTSQRGAVAAAERVRTSVLAAGFPQVRDDRRVTVTAGVATSRTDESIEALLARADRGLYEGKAGGRNRVIAVG